MLLCTALGREARRHAGDRAPRRTVLSPVYRRCPPLWRPAQTASAADITAPEAARIARSIRTRSDPTAPHHAAQTFSPAGVTEGDPRTSLRSLAPAGWLPLCSFRSAERAWWLSSQV